jgi:hypothetical protein
MEEADQPQEEDVMVESPDFTVRSFRYLLIHVAGIIYLRKEY